MLLQETGIPDNLAYLVLGIAVLLTIIGGWLVSYFLRQMTGCPPGWWSQSKPIPIMPTRPAPSRLSQGAAVSDRSVRQTVQDHHGDDLCRSIKQTAGSSFVGFYTPTEAYLRSPVAGISASYC